MCLVASGAAELYHEAGIHVWDVAAGALVVTEAGGTVIDTAGTCGVPRRTLVLVAGPHAARCSPELYRHMARTAPLNRLHILHL